MPFQFNNKSATMKMRSPFPLAAAISPVAARRCPGVFAGVRAAARVFAPHVAAVWPPKAAGILGLG